jgi:hypothetical protein
MIPKNISLLRASQIFHVANFGTTKKDLLISAYSTNMLDNQLPATKNWGGEDV